MFLKITKQAIRNRTATIFYSFFIPEKKQEKSGVSAFLRLIKIKARLGKVGGKPINHPRNIFGPR